MTRKLATLVATVGAFAVTVPAVAHPGPAHQPDNASHPSHKCAPHKVGYIESGTVDSATASTLAANPDGTWSGTLVVNVKHANHWAKADKSTTVTYTFTNAKLHVHFDGGTTGFASGEHVQLIGKLATVSKKCSALTPAAAPDFRTVVVHPAS